MTTLIVSGMSCGACARTVTDAVQKVDPMAVVEIDRETRRVEIHSSASVDAFKASIEDAGYLVGSLDQVG